jgi:hypothetical protein
MSISELLTKFNAGELIGLVAVVGGLLCAICGIIASSWLKARKSDNITRLKQDLVDRGMSADEIERIVSAGWKTPCR